jgi:proline-specific peptidase
VISDFTTEDGRRLSYRRQGRGPSLVCHPGGPGASARYFGDLAGLGAHFDLVLLDPRGTGGSERPADPRAYTIADYVADLDELRRHLALDRMSLLGHSHGGVVAMAYAAQHPERVGRLVTASTLARFHSEQREAMDRAMEAKAGEPWYEDACAAIRAEQAGEWGTDEELGELVRRELPFYVSRYGHAERTYLASLEGEVWAGDALKLFNEEIFDRFDLRSDLARIEAPTLVIAGGDDFITGPACAREIAAAISGASLVLLPGCGHFVFVEAREAFQASVLGFLTGD